ncbi:MAG TPA: glycoside hydrolase family 9 protein [Polyangiaceae bacterium]
MSQARALALAFSSAAVICAACGAPQGSSHARNAASPPSAPAALPPSKPAPVDRAAITGRLGNLSVLPSAHNLVKNPGFDGGKSLPWMASFSAPAKGEAAVEGGAYCVSVANPGKNAWDASFRHREMILERGHTYAVRLKIAATAPTSALLKVGMSGPPYSAYWQKQIDAGPDPKVVTGEFTMTAPDDPTAEIAFQTGGSAAAQQPFDVCVDDVVLEDPTFTPKPDAPPPPIPDILVNQVGYPPGLGEIAILKSDAKEPVSWELIDATGHAVASGTSKPRGLDPASGDHVHEVDFSSFTRAGSGYVVRAASASSHPFDIGANVYGKLAIDALRYFYHSRSGTPIAMPYAGEAKWARPAGHPGDKSVPCAPDAHCDYALDVSGGWYDAGDHGKYVVNGGISTWTLMNVYERAKAFGLADDLGDGPAHIPESHNGVPDVLDEARWELEFMLKMQVPEGKPLAGMVHHKVHDREWTGLATRPDEDKVPRFLRPVSTAATLDLAATAAQAARLWKSLDAPFSARCLVAAERAWAAAAAHPDLYITAADGVGGGAYEDSHVSDELYWAAAELYVTTKKAIYIEKVPASPHHDAMPIGEGGGDATAMTWQSVGALGTISLALAQDAALKPLAASARAAIVKAAGELLGIDENEGYRLPFRPDAEGKYPWGSTSAVLNNAVVLGLAADFSKDGRYLPAVEDALSYILGRNPMDQSFVTGYGSRPLEHPHHRFWAHQANSAFPEPPPGVLSGGPNSGLQDPYVKAAGLAGCAPMKCFVDHIEAWSANEEAINWNAPLVWVAAFLDEHARHAKPAPKAHAASPVLP